MTRIIIFMAMALCLWQEVQGQDDPCLIFVGEPTSADGCPTPAVVAAARPTTGQAVALKHNNITRGLSATDSSRYRAFWIMGDGNFIPSGDHLEKSEDIKTLEINYIYSKLGSFDIYPVLIEKKSNGRPPGTKLRRTDTSLPVARFADGARLVDPPLVKGTPFTRRLTPSNRADMLNSEKIRLGGYETALVTSTALPSSGTQQVALVFYNSLRTDRLTPFFAGALFPSEPTVLRANYTGAVHKTGDTTILLPQLQYAANKQGYLNVIAQQVEVLPGIKPDTFSEFRFFPLFKTKPKDNPNSLSYSTGIAQLDRSAQGETQFLTLVLENVTVNPDFKQGSIDAPPLLLTGQANGGSQLSTQERSRIVELLTTYFPQILEGMTPQELADLRIHNTNIFIRGAAYRSAAIVSSIDPTSLDVLQICPKGNGQYDVSMKMTVCNEGNMPEPVVSVDIYKTNGLQVIDPKFTDVQDLYNVGYNQQDTIWEFEYHNLDGAYNAVGQYTSSCFSKPFSFTTDWAGVQLLKARKGLTAKVHFESALILPVQFFDSEPFSPNVPVTQENGYKCGDPEPKDCWWLYVILFALGLVAWWYWKTKKEEEAS